ncbi:hypothetical protein GC209_10440 [bacterium]|nr:hypothetical protein [bacterium]
MTDHSADTSALAARLARVPTTIACDILKDHGLAERAARGLRPMTPLTSFAGPARMIEFLPGRPELRKPGPPANFALVDAVQPAEVLVLCAHGGMEGAVLGDMLATRARMRGGQGAVVDGAVRDLDGIAAAGLPVHAKAVAPMAAHATLVPCACDRPVRFAGVTVMPGDWVLADRDGILFLPRDLVGLVLARHEAALARDTFSRHLLEMGFALTEVFPLPQVLDPWREALQAGAEMPSAETIRAALAKGAHP